MWHDSINGKILITPFFSHLANPHKDSIISQLPYISFMQAGEPIGKEAKPIGI